MKVYIQKPLIDDMGFVKIFLIEDNANGRYQVTMSKTPPLLELTKLEEDHQKELEPFLELPHNYFNDIVKGFIDYASDNDIKTENETLLEGKYEITREYLDDLKIHFNDVLQKMLIR